MQNIPFLDLPGPDFLNVFGVLVIAVLAATALVIHFADRTDPVPPPVPEHPDAMEVAFLQGQETPTIQSAEADFNTLGIQFRGYMAWGCKKAEKVTCVAMRPS